MCAREGVGWVGSSVLAAVQWTFIASVQYLSGWIVPELNLLICAVGDHLANSDFGESIELCTSW